ncbi:MAG: hypothetical protein HYW70_01055 [Candidatus Nealsonbacteria bacterium]|nr:hypothetical protein [Candidatus Nealsonbacteria bacterium]
MQIFEIHFNPKKETGTVFDTFCYEPESPFEKNLGNLYIISQLAHVLPPNSQLLEKLSQIIKNEYYSKSQRNPESSLKESLKKANEFLSKETQNGNVSWMGNLDMAILSIKNSLLNFTRVGSIEVYLQRGEELIDISSNLEFQNMEPYPLKVFGSIASGKLALEDKIISFTKEPSQLLLKDNLILELAGISDQKSLNQFLKEKKEAFSSINGACLFLIATKDSFFKNALTAKEPLKYFPLRFPIPKIALPPKNVSLIIILLVFVLTGFLIFRMETSKETKIAKENIELARSKKVLAESFLILKNRDKAVSLLQEALEIINPYPEKPEVLNLKNSIEATLKTLTESKE